MYRVFSMNNVESLIFYLCLFSLSALLFFYAQKRNHKLFTIISLLIPILISSLRYNVGTDYPIYVNIFNRTQGQSLLEFIANGSNEIGFYAISKLSFLVTGDATLLFAIFSLITILFFYLGLKRFRISHKPLIFFLFLLNIFPGSFNGVRQSAAVSVCFYAFSFILDKKPGRFIFWTIIAATLHTSAIATLPLYLLSLISTKIDFKVASFLQILKSLSPSLILLAAFPLLFPIIGAIDLFSHYETYQDIVLAGNNYTFLLYLVILIALLLAARRLISSKTDLSFLSLSAIGTVFMTLGFMSTPIKRIAMYFTIFPLLLMPKFIDMFNDRFGKFICYTLLIAYGIIFFIISFYILNQSSIFPYKSIMEG